MIEGVAFVAMIFTTKKGVDSKCLLPFDLFAKDVAADPEPAIPLDLNDFEMR